MLLREQLARGSADQLVCAASIALDAILIALDGDMKKIMRENGMGSGEFKRLSLVKLSCSEPDAAERLKYALSLIEHEWRIPKENNQRKIFIEKGSSFIKTNR